jgi:transcriptional antiterminator RfaH
MPLLPPETFLFPADLLDRPAAELNLPGHWWALHTRPRAEKVLARKFLSRGLAFYLPLHERRWRSRGRQLRSHLPLFPGYLFLHGDDAARLQALETNAIVNCLAVADQNRLHEDLTRIHRLVTSGEPLTPEAALVPGTRVEIVRGPFAGMEGTVLKQGRQLRFFVEVQFLQQGVSVEVEEWMIQPAEGKASAAVAGAASR